MPFQESEEHHICFAVHLASRYLNAPNVVPEHRESAERPSVHTGSDRITMFFLLTRTLNLKPIVPPFKKERSAFETEIPVQMEARYS